jgi:monovalent cation:proton antiporter-2 (CPA2) family protein
MNAHGPGALALIYLLAMVITAPIAKRAGLGAVLGYLIAGALAGPDALGLVGRQQDDVLHLAEFGIIMMLFLIGLELKPAVLWKLRGPIFGLGGLQVAGTAAAILGIALAWGMPWQIGLAVGLVLAASSTAIALQTLQEKGLLKSSGGQTAFSVLLFQDIAVIPILAGIPILAASLHAGAPATDASAAPAWQQVAKILGAVVCVIGAGKLLIRPIFKAVVGSQLRELSTALALLLVLATTLLMEVAGLSPALGAFLAGVVLAESEYRHQLEADIEPFKGILLAIFFISVGAGIDFKRVAADPGWIAAGVLSLILIKFGVLWAIGRFARLARPDQLLFAFSLAQGGEFAFVLLGYTQRSGLLAEQPVQMLTAIVALSMGLAPLLINAYALLILPRFAAATEEREPDAIDEKDNPVIVAGFGRFGQGVTRFLRSCGVECTVLDFDPEQVDIVRKFGFKAFYGDASRMDLLRSAGAERARLLIIAIDDKDKATEMVESVQKEFPHLKLLVRAYDRLHAYELIHRGVQDVHIETAGSAINLGSDALRALGFRANRAVQLAQSFRKRNEQSIRELAKLYHEEDEETYITHAKGWLSALEQTMRNDVAQTGSENSSMDRAWESPPPPPQATP